jgi:hypothetical protein
MKKLFITLLSVGLALGVFAQRGHVGGGGYFYRPHVSIGFGAFGPFYGYPYFGYGPFYGNPYYGYNGRPSKLMLQIQDIKNDYRDKIWSARQDKSLPRKERREKIHELNQERDNAILGAKRNYYKN